MKTIQPDQLTLEYMKKRLLLDEQVKWSGKCSQTRKILESLPSPGEK